MVQGETRVGGGLGGGEVGGRVVGVETEAKEAEIQISTIDRYIFDFGARPPQRAPNIVERASGSGSAGLDRYTFLAGNTELIRFIVSYKI